MDEERTHTDRANFINAIWLITQVAVVVLTSLLIGVDVALGLAALVFFLAVVLRSNHLPSHLSKIPHPRWVGAIGFAGALVFSLYAIFYVDKAQSPEGTPKLEVLDVAVVPAPVEMTLEDWDGTKQIQTVERSALDLFIRNDGASAAYLTGLEFRVESVWTLEECYPGGGPVHISYEYDVFLPRDATQGTVVYSSLRQEVQADESDRFTVTMGLADEVELVEPQALIYALDVTLRHDVSNESHIGRVVVADRYPDLDTYWEHTGDTACEERNSAIAQEVVAQNAIMSTELNGLLISRS